MRVAHVVIPMMFLAACSKADRDAAPAGHPEAEARTPSVPAPTPAPTPAAGCPPEDLIEELHAAAFHFQHGPVAEARRHLAGARGLAGAPLDPQSRDILAALSRVSTLVEAEPDRAASDTEYIRLQLSDWGCLTAELHDAFHAKLPPIPGGGP